MAKSFVNSVLDATKSTMPGHFETLLGERPRGSKWGGEMTEEILRRLPWVEDTPHESVAMSGCRYFQCWTKHLFPNATVGAVPLKWLAGVRCDVAVVEGAHGKELITDARLDVEAHTATLIVGTHEGKEVVFTVHPGDPLLPVPADFDGLDLKSLSPHTAVKLV